MTRALIASLLLTAPAAAAEKPNVVLVLADDLGRGDLSCYGGTVAATPHLDRMAKEGVRFDRYYAAAPICSPSRCGLLTGQFPARWRVTSFLQTRAGNRACEMADFLDPKAPTLPRALRAAGYRTAHVGKWHLGGGRDVADAPKFAAYGYDLGVGTWESPEPHPDLTARDWIWSLDDKVKRWDRTGWMVDRTLDFLRADADAPCFVNLWLDDPHTPWVPTADDQQVGKGGRATGKGDTPERLAKVLAETDRQVGRLLDAVRGRKGRPTVVLFLSDNGPLPTFDRKRTAGLRGSKLSLYEGGVRVPLIAWGPGVVPAGPANETTVVGGVDLFPTLCKLCGADRPKGYEPDGEDLSAALLGKAPRRTKPLFWEYGRNATSFAYPPVKADRSPNVAMLDGDWKLLVNADGSGAELYDLAADPKEATDLAGAKPEVARRLAAAAVAWRKSVP
ncbi:MAG: N-acetylgalactosamine-6-sulfatase [Isosphaera sp.]|nr:N-acetylgalactosamine-6-sulfatase [Isosphaera sp.]